MTLQYRWYLENADLDVAERYLLAAHETILRIAEWPGLGCRRHFQAPELTHIRSIQVIRPYDCHLLFYMESETLRIERVMHGARDPPEPLAGRSSGIDGNGVVVHPATAPPAAAIL